MKDVNFDISMAIPSTEFTNTAIVKVLDYSASADAKFKVCNYADLSVTKITTKSIGYVFEPLIYIIEVSNKGSSKATGVILTDILSSNSIYTSIYLTQGKYICSKDRITFYLGELNCNSNAFAIITSIPQHSGILTNHTFVTANECDTNYSNNSFKTNTKICCRYPKLYQSLPSFWIILVLFSIYGII